ncbi:MAG TPA: SusD/RagB family nutrient-binding outer membrane lipoprotein [Gemmatimonadaceae bacterium]|nr:SusD/RagB family nutrient-binding outer membrane lipoprotein [Gemmatimonadaceae bacterium]
MKRRHIAVALAVLSVSSACSDYLDVNTNPNGPQTVTANLYLPPMIYWMATSPQWDGRFVGHYTQEWYSTSTSSTSPALTWAKMGFQQGSDNGAEQWRDVYWSLGQGLVDMNDKATAEQRWDVLGVGLILKAWGWQVLTDLHGPIIIKEAFDQSRTKFDYDSQEFAYGEVQRLLDSAIVLLNRTDGAVDANYLSVGDHMYNGDRTKWLKLAHGMLALNLNHYSNKASYAPAQVISEVDKSFESNADDALLPYPGVSPDNADKNFWGPTRGNITAYRQTQFVLDLMNGTDFGGVVDPRMTRMLSPSPDGQYRGLDPNIAGFGGLPDDQKPNNFFGYAGSVGPGLPSRYLFADHSKIPVMTYSQLQFIKAEAALRMGDQATAHTAYVNGISSHIDFVNARDQDDGQAETQISPAEKQAFLASPEIVPPVLTLSHIMSQKYIAQWAWGHNEMWMDMRRYHYTDVDPVSGVEIFRGFAPPSPLYPLNAGKVVQRIRPRYNSEYVWNFESLQAIGGDADDYHTVPLWIIQP